MSPSACEGSKFADRYFYGISALVGHSWLLFSPSNRCFVRVSSLSWLWYLASAVLPHKTRYRPVMISVAPMTLQEWGKCQIVYLIHLFPFTWNILTLRLRTYPPEYNWSPRTMDAIPATNTVWTGWKLDTNTGPPFWMHQVCRTITSPDDIIPCNMYMRYMWRLS